MTVEERKVEERVKKLIEPLLRSMGYKLFDVEFRRERGWTLRVIIDKEGGISLKDCELVSRRLSPLLDVEDPIPFPYLLEVSSPGLNRELKKPEHFNFFKGKPVRLILKEEVQGKREIEGKIGEVKEGLLRVITEGGELFIPLGVIAKAKLNLI